MRHIVSNSEVAHLWIHNAQDSASNGHHTFFFDGKTIYSYGRHFPIATDYWNKRGERLVLFTTRNYSKITQQHKRRVGYAIPDTVPVVYVPEVCESAILSIDKNELHSRNIKDFQLRLSNKLFDAENARKYAVEYLGQYGEILEQAQEYEQFFDLPSTCVRDESRISAIQQRIIRLRISLEEREVKWAEQEAKKEKELIDSVLPRWRNREVTDTNLYRLSYAYLRVSADGSEVETTKGAKVPLGHVRLAYQFWKKVVQNGETYHTNGHSIHLGVYTLDAILKNGTVKAGCHTFSRAEIEQFAASQNW